MSPEISNAQEEDHETDANGVELTQQPKVSSETNISAEPNPAEKRAKNDENELHSEMDVTLEANKLKLSNEESNAQTGDETDANGNEATDDMEVLLQGLYFKCVSGNVNCTRRRI